MQLSFTLGGGVEKMQGSFFPSVKNHNPNKSEVIDKVDISRKNHKVKRDGTTRVTSFLDQRESMSFDRSCELLVDTTSILTDPSNLVTKPLVLNPAE